MRVLVDGDHEFLRLLFILFLFFFSSRRRHTRFKCDWSSDVCSSDLLLIAEGRKGLGFLESLPVVVINPKVEHVVRHHPEHNPVAEHAGLAEHTPRCDAANRSELLAQEFGEAVARYHPRSSALRLPFPALGAVFVFLGHADPEGFEEAVPSQLGDGDGAGMLHPLRPAEIKAAFHERGSDRASDVRASFGPIEAQPAECGAARTRRGKFYSELRKKTGAC